MPRSVPGDEVGGVKGVVTMTLHASAGVNWRWEWTPDCVIWEHGSQDGTSDIPDQARDRLDVDITPAATRRHGATSQCCNDALHHTRDMAVDRSNQAGNVSSKVPAVYADWCDHPVYRRIHLAVSRPRDLLPRPVYCWADLPSHSRRANFLPETKRASQFTATEQTHA